MTAAKVLKDPRATREPSSSMASVLRHSKRQTTKAQRIEELEIAVRAALSFVQGRHTDHNDGHAQTVIAALRGALAKRERD